MDDLFAQQFVAEWLREWNSHDLEALLDHYADDVVFTSPVAVQLLDDSDGIIRGKRDLRAYWTEGLRRIPDLHFEVVGTYVGVNVLVINYRNQRGVLVAEVLIFNGPVIVAGHGSCGLAQQDDPAGTSPD